MEKIQQILKSDNLSAKKALFQFTVENTDEEIQLKFNLWARYFFPKYFTSKDAKFHSEIDLYNIQAYKGTLTSFVNIAFRGAAKTVRTKLFFAYAIANDKNSFRKYIKVLAYAKLNSKQITTDIYNMLVNARVKEMYPEIFVKSDLKREETMNSFTTSKGVKVLADTVGTDQRGALQESARPDLVWYEDFENRKTLRSSTITYAIWQNMEEARTGMAVNGASIYTCNYVSEAGNVHKLVTKEAEKKKVLIIPIIKDKVIAWDRYTLADIERMRQEDEDFEGERLCNPAISSNVYFDRKMLEQMPVIDPIRKSAEFRIYKEFNPSHRYGSGHDVAGGVGLDSSTSVFIDFDTMPAQVVGVFDSNVIKPESFGDEIYRQQEIFGGCISGVENNYGTEAILRLKQLGANLYIEPSKDHVIGQPQPKKYGWNTNSLTRPKMLAQLSRAIEDGLLALNDKKLIDELKGYTRDDLLDKDADPRMTTRHFDLLMACAIAWQMKDYAKVETTKKKSYTPNFQHYRR